MNVEAEKSKILRFVKTGLVALSLVLIVALSIRYIPEAAAVLSYNKKALPIYCVKTDKPQIALSFDAAWGNEDTKQILDILAKHNVKVTFFMTGGWIEKYPDDVKAIAEAGHDLGNHSENHKQMSTLSKEQSVEELMKPHKKVKELTGKDMVLFRPPYSNRV